MKALHVGPMCDAATTELRITTLATMSDYCTQPRNTARVTLVHEPTRCGEARKAIKIDEYRPKSTFNSARTDVVSFKETWAKAGLLCPDCV